MSQFGMGFVYTKTNLGTQFLNPTKEYKQKIYQNYYSKHHNKLDNVVESSVKKQKTVLLDCHSFSKNIIMFDNKKDNLPDICIGFDSLYYNEELVNYIKSYFEKLGYSVEFNYPYSGTMIPNRFFENKTDNLCCVMIEINKEIYVDEHNNKTCNFKNLKIQINTLLKEL